MTKRANTKVGVLGIPVKAKTIANSTTVCMSSEMNVIVIGVE